MAACQAHHAVPRRGGAEPVGYADDPRWRAILLGNGVSETMAAKAYRLLRAVLMTAVNEDELLRTNPCRIPGADQEKPAERPVLALAQVLKLGVPGLHFHDLRRTGNTIAARTGGSTRDLMARMGHDSPQASMIYQHATSEVDRAIAQAVSDAVKAEREKAKKPAADLFDKAKKAGKKRG